MSDVSLFAAMMVTMTLAIIGFVIAWMCSPRLRADVERPKTQMLDTERAMDMRR